jgi:hypothetical protein
MLSNGFDPMAIVVDWLDACRARSLEDLLDLYDARGTLRCLCDGPYIYSGRDDLARYWSTRLERAVPHAFSVTELVPDDSGGKPGVVLDYVAYDGKPVHIRFQFTRAGKIEQTVCGPGRRRSVAA